MSSPQKIKGSKFERDIAELLTKLIKKSSWSRIPMSGAIGTNMGISHFRGDVNGTVDSMPKKFKIEAKVGYGGAKQLTLKREWLEKIKEEAESDYAIPLMAGKFSGSRGTVKTFICMDTDTFAYLINYITDLDEQLQEAISNECVEQN